MRFLLTCARKDLRRRLADPMALILWLAIPLFIGGLMSVLFGRGGGTALSISVLLVDDDASIAGRLLGGAAGSGQASFLQIERVNRTEGLERMNAGEASAMLVLPPGFTDAVLNERPTTLSLVRNPAQRILPAIVETARY